MDASTIKHISARVLFATELLIFTWVYLYGAYGFSQLLRLREECAHITTAKKEKETSVATLQKSIAAWNAHPFEKERLAREQLQMARKDEIVYMLDN